MEDSVSRGQVGLPRSVRGRNPGLLRATRGAYGTPLAVVVCREDVLAVVVPGGRVFHRGRPAELHLAGADFVVTWPDVKTGQPREQRMPDWPVGCRRCPDGTHVIDSRALTIVVNADEKTRVDVRRVTPPVRFE